MSDATRSYRTIAHDSGPYEWKARKSKFLGYAYRVSDPVAVADVLADLWKEHKDATHVCYGFRIGREQPVLRAHDDGEPAHSAGAPILAQIKGQGLYDVLVAVVRYYGGTKLGVGGLIQAYRETASGAIEMAGTKTNIPLLRIALTFDYPVLDQTLRTIEKYQLKVADRQMALDCRLVLEIPFAEAESIRDVFRAIPEVSWHTLDGAGNSNPEHQDPSF